MVASFDGHLKGTAVQRRILSLSLSALSQRQHLCASDACIMMRRNGFVVMLNEKEKETSLSAGYPLCAGAHERKISPSIWHILEDDLLPAQILAIKRPLQQRYPNAEIRYDCRENDVLWFVCQMEDAATMVGG